MLRRREVGRRQISQGLHQHSWNSRSASLTVAGKDAILQPPKPEIPPSAEVLQRVAGRDADWEAAD